jgi:hypothetical protein
MHHIYSLLALDIATDRVRESREAHRAAELSAGPSFGRPSAARRVLAQGFAAISRGTAAAARRLDHVAADDLGRALAPSK